MLAAIEIKPFKEWHEDFGPCIFYIPMTNEAPIVHCGTPHDSDWPWDSEIEEWEDDCWWHPVPKKIDELSC